MFLNCLFGDWLIDFFMGRGVGGGAGRLTKWRAFFLDTDRDTGTTILGGLNHARTRLNFRLHVRFYPAELQMHMYRWWHVICCRLSECCLRRLVWWPNQLQHWRKSWVSLVVITYQEGGTGHILGHLDLDSNVVSRDLTSVQRDRLRRIRILKYQTVRSCCRHAATGVRVNAWQETFNSKFLVSSKYNVAAVLLRLQQQFKKNLATQMHHITRFIPASSMMPTYHVLAPPVWTNGSMTMVCHHFTDGLTDWLFEFDWLTVFWRTFGFDGTDQLHLINFCTVNCECGTYSYIHTFTVIQESYIHTYVTYLILAWTLLWYTLSGVHCATMRHPKNWLLLMVALITSRFRCACGMRRTATSQLFSTQKFHNLLRESSVAVPGFECTGRNCNIAFLLVAHWKEMTGTLTLTLTILNFVTGTVLSCFVFMPGTSGIKLFFPGLRGVCLCPIGSCVY